MLELFVRRPVLAGVMSIIITLLGLIALTKMPMALFPSVAPPEVNVTVEYTGANAETVTKAAIVPLERAINGVPGMKYMSSDAGNDGVGVVQVLFETGTDPDVAAINVQNRVNEVMGQLPPEVLANGVKIAKEVNAMLMYLSIHSSNPDHDEKFLYNFADLNVLAELKRVDGVGYADILGAKEYAMRIWLDPAQMIRHDISTEDVLRALDENNLEAAPGKIGENSDRASSPLQYTVRYAGKFNTEEAYRNIPLRANVDGSILRIRDVANVEFGTTYFDVEAKFDGRPAASIMLKQLPGSNASEVIAALKARLELIERQSFLPGMSYDVSFDVSRFLDASIREVVRTLVEAFILVGLVVFLFLQNWRSTLIPILAVPVSLVGTFFVTQLFDFSLNMITLFAIVLAIGIVVDNAIVVVEAVYHKLEHTDLDPLAATLGSMKEIGPAIVGMTLVMGSVFVPLGFIDGPAGVFYRESGLTLAVAIGLSGLIALTLTPALCAAFLRRPKPNSRSRLAAAFGVFNRGYTRFEQGVMWLLRHATRSPLVSLGLLGVFTAGLAIMIQWVPTGFIPSEDQGMFYVSVTSPPGATLERTKDVVNTIAVVGRNVDGVESIATLAGSNVLSDGTGASYGTCIVNLEPWDARTRSVDEVIEEFKQLTSHIQAADIEFFPPPSVPGYGNASGFELRLLDKTGRGDLDEMESVVKKFVADLRARPEVASAFSIFSANYPQYTVDLDIDKAAQKGVTLADALQTLQTLLGSEYATNFVRFNRMYKVMVQAAPEHRSIPDQLLQVRVRNGQGELVPLSAFATLQKSYGVDQITRYNMYPSAELNGEGHPGISSGTVLAAVREVADEKLPTGFAIDWAGISLDEVNSGNQGLIVGLIALLFVYLVLAGQYESFLLPAGVILSLPPGFFGAIVFLHWAGLENNIFTHIALVVLIGLLGKNATLIIEFAEQRCRVGDAPLQAVLHAARLRLRPILMTSMAFTAGLIPLAIATGAGATANRTIGTATIGGMFMGTVWGVLLVPGLYLVLKRLQSGRVSAPERVPTDMISEVVG